MDYNATTPVAPEAINAAAEAMERCWGNPSSGHFLGRKARRVLEEARESVAACINAEPGEIIFTSGGTESNNTVLLGLLNRPDLPGRHIVTSRIEHPSVLNPCKQLARKGWDITLAGVDRGGTVLIDQVLSALKHETCLVSVMLANNETGVIQPVEKICETAHARGIPVHADAAQAIGKMEVNVKALGVDFMTIAGHKLYAPKGIGALYVRKGSPWGNIMFGAGQENGMRPGTEPVPLAAGLGAACRLAAQDLKEEIVRIQGLRDRFLAMLHDISGHAVIRLGTPRAALPNTLLVSFPGLTGAEILRASPGIMASTGAACHDRKESISHVLAAMDVPEDVARGALRFSIGRYTTDESVEAAAGILKHAIDRLKKSEKGTF